MSLVPASEPNVRLADLSPEYSEIMVLGKVLQASGYFRDVRDQAQAVTKILFGRELGISPINSMAAIHIIEGKPTLSSNMLAALIKRSGKYDYRVLKNTSEECVLMFKQKIDGKWEDLGESSFTMADARAAGVAGKDVWKKYAKAMLFARALSQGERTYCPDVSVCALYVPEELGAEVNEQGELIGEVVAGGKFNVPRTTEPIPIPRNPAIVAAQDSAGKGPEKVADKPQEGKSTAVGAPPPRERQPGEDDDDEGNYHQPLVDAIAKMTGGETFIDEPIDLSKQRNLHRSFKDAVRAQMTDNAKDNLFRDWLKNQGYVGPDGKGSTKVVPVYLFDEVKANAVKFAETLK